MSETNRLRRLDALFAERVMGHTIPPAHRSMTSYDGGPPVVVGESATGDYCCYYGSIPRYTRSLDAAWEGVAKVHNPYVALFDDVRAGKERGWCCGFDPDENQSFSFEAHSAHPAEALVLACLRAVGVEESELH